MSRPPRGGAALGVVLLLALLGMIALGHAQRSVIFETRVSVNQQRATQAFEAAEAALAWSVAQLNDVQPEARCASTSIRAWGLADVAGAPQHASCVREGGGWRCTCASEAAAAPSPADDGAVSFAVHLQRQPAGHLEAAARGCTGGGCRLSDGPATGMRHEATSSHRTLVARLPGLAATPQAAIVARGSIDLRGAGPTFIESADTGLTLHGGAGVQPGTARLAVAPGAPVSASIADHDAPLATLDADRFFTSVFGIDRMGWRDQPAVHRIACATACDDALLAALERDPAPAMVWLAGGLHLNRARRLGHPDRPVLLVVDGPVTLQTPVVLHGVVYATTASWSSASDVQIHGAVVAQGDLHPTGPWHVRHDANVIAQLQRRTGTFAPVPGSWRDF